MPTIGRRALLINGGLALAAPPMVGRPQRLELLMDMVHHNPGEPPTETAFNDPRKLASYGHDAQVVNEFKPPHTAITFDTFDPRIFPAGSAGREWVEGNARAIDERVARIHAAGLRAFYFTDLIVLPKALIELYGERLLNLDDPLTQRVHRIMLAEVFDRFPTLDGLVIRTGETYLSNVPFHTGGNPITRGADSHLILLDLLREEVCVKRGKQLFYRTWSFDGFHTDPAYYLKVTDRVDPHPNLTFSIKHTRGDYFRTIAFNPTLGIGRHPQIVEVECQREYEGKGAHPNYVAGGVINGFEETPGGLRDLVGNPLLRGVWTWSRGGGWRGPYVKNELWCDLDVYVISRWARDPRRDERSIFSEYGRRLGLPGPERERLRELALTSAAAVLRGHYGLAYQVRKLTWTRDQFLGGSDKDLAGDFQRILDAGLAARVLAEKAEAVTLWERIDRLAARIHPRDPGDAEHLRVSSRYGLLLHRVIHHGWTVMLTGFMGDKSGTYDTATIRAHLVAYDRAWADYRRLALNPLCASLYLPQSFGRKNADGTYDADPDHGLRQSVDRYRQI